MTTVAMFSVPQWSIDLDLIRSADIDTCNSILRSIEQVEERGFIWRGIVLQEIERRELWRDDDGGYHSMADWINRKPGKSARDRYAALAAVKELKDVPLADLASMPRCNVETMKHLSDHVRVQPSVIEAAKGTEDGFIDHIQEHHPTQHIEHRKRLIFRPTESQKAVIEAALDEVGRLLEVESREGQLEALCADWLQERATDE